MSATKEELLAEVRKIAPDITFDEASAPDGTICQRATATVVGRPAQFVASKGDDEQERIFLAMLPDMIRRVERKRLAAAGGT